MSLVVLTGAARSGKSGAAEKLAASRGRDVVVAVAGWDGDEEMQRRIEAHRSVRPIHWETIVVAPEPGWVEGISPDATLVLDCLGSLVGAIAWEEAGEAEVAPVEVELRAAQRCRGLVAALTARAGDTVVVTNEAGWGVVPSSAAGRLFRDLLGRANRELVEAADAAWVVVDGRCIDLKALPSGPRWPDAGIVEV